MGKKDKKYTDLNFAEHNYNMKTFPKNIDALKETIQNRDFLEVEKNCPGREPA
ncbi:MAG: hypothetical protein ACLFUZ_02155 [Candidatus Micrarchaeia archaeon]